MLQLGSGCVKSKPSSEAGTGMRMKHGPLPGPQQISQSDQQQIREGIVKSLVIVLPVKGHALLQVQRRHLRKEFSMLGQDAPLWPGPFEACLQRQGSYLQASSLGDVTRDCAGATHLNFPC